MRKRLSRFLASALVLCCLTCAVSATADTGRIWDNWTLDEYLKYVGAENLLDGYTLYLEDNSVWATLKIGGFSRRTVFERPYITW